MSMQPASLLSSEDFSTSQVSPDTPLRRKACIGCKTRKVKCNKELPCKNCTEWKIECTYPSPVRKCRRARSSTTNAKAKRGEPVPETPEELNARMRNLETVVQDLTKLIESERRGFQALLAQQAQPQPTSSADGSEGMQSSVNTPMSNSSNGTRTQASHRPSKHLSVNTDRQESVENSMRTPGSNHSSTFSTSSTAQSTFSKHSFGNQFMDLAMVRPTPSQAQVCLEAFLEKVDPLVKVVHKPTLQTIVVRRTYDEGAITKGEDALLLAICFTAAITMSDKEVESCFGMPKNAALITRRCAVEQALLESDPSTIEEMSMLQAFVLYLSFNRFMDETKLTWAICALARCISSSLQADFDPPSFDSEMEKRLWWQLWYLDQRAAEDHGLTPSLEIDYCPSLPLNINDTDLFPDTDIVPVARKEWTDMSFCLMRFEISKASQEIGGLFPHYHGLLDHEPTSLPAKESTIKDCHRKIQSTYIRYCVGSEPIHWLARHVARVLVAELWFKLYGSLRPSPQTEATHIRLVQMASDIADIPKLLEEDSQARQWSWLIDAYIHFLPLAFILTESCQLPSSEIMQRAWKVAEAGFARWSEDIKISKNGEILSVLMAKARAVKEGKQQPQFSKPMPTNPMNANIPGPTLLDGVTENPYMPNPYYEHLGGDFNDLAFVLDNSALNTFSFPMNAQEMMPPEKMYDGVNMQGYLANAEYGPLDYGTYDQSIPSVHFQEHG